MTKDQESEIKTNATKEIQEIAEIISQTEQNLDVLSDWFGVRDTKTGQTVQLLKIFLTELIVRKQSKEKTSFLLQTLASVIYTTTSDENLKEVLAALILSAIPEKKIMVIQEGNDLIN